MSWRPQFLVAIEPIAVALVLASSLLMALLAALLPARSVARRVASLSDHYTTVVKRGRVLDHPIRSIDGCVFA